MEDSKKENSAKENFKKENSKKGKEKKPSFFKGVKTEFAKVSWPDKSSIVRQSVAVIGVSVVVGAVITLLDTVIQFGIKFLTM